MKIRIAYVNLSFFAHATEDQEKVLAAARNLFPPGYADKVPFSRIKLDGEYNNPIVFFKAQIREPEIVRSLLLNISSNLPLADKENLTRHLNLHLDGGNLYLRFDKQEAYRGRFKICMADPIRVHIRFKTSDPKEIRESCREIGLLYEEGIR